MSFILNRKKIIGILSALILVICSWGYKTYIATPCINFEKVVLKKDGMGNEVNLASLQGKATLVAFFQTWCSDCVKEMPTILNLQNQIQDKNLKVVMVSDESVEKLEKFKNRFPNFIFDYYLTTEKLPSFGIKKYPTTYLVDGKGNILKSTLEGNNWGSLEIVELVRKQLNQ